MHEHDETQTRQAIIDACIRMNALGINQGTSGNISVRYGDGLLITPTRVPYELLKPEDIVSLSFDGTASGKHQPSSEWRIHRDIMRAKSEVHAIVHAHPSYSTIIAIMGKDIPPLHYMVAVAGGNDIRCAPYALFGSQELSDHAIAALQGRKACLLGNHGIVATGDSLQRALWLAVEVETLAKEFHGCLQIGGPTLLSDEQMNAVRVQMSRGYART